MWRINLYCTDLAIIVHWGVGFSSCCSWNGSKYFLWKSVPYVVIDGTKMSKRLDSKKKMDGTGSRIVMSKCVCEMVERWARAPWVGEPVQKFLSTINNMEFKRNVIVPWFQWFEDNGPMPSSVFSASPAMKVQACSGMWSLRSVYYVICISCLKIIPYWQVLRPFLFIIVL